MVAAGVGRAADLHAFHGFCRVLVLALHEPARLVSAERQVGQTETPVFFGGGMIVETPVKTGIAYMVDLATGRFQNKGRPQRHAPIIQPARRPVVARLEMDFDSGTNLKHIAPIARGNLRCLNPGADDNIIAKRRDEVGFVVNVKLLQRLQIQMIIMIMRDQHEIDRRQICKLHTGRIDALGPDKAEGAGALRPDRIDQNIQACRLDEKGCVADEGDAQVLAVHALIGFHEGKRARIGLGPCRLLPIEAPFHQVNKSVRRFPTRIKKPCAIEMIRKRAFIIGACAGLARIKATTRQKRAEQRKFEKFASVHDKSIGAAQDLFKQADAR